MNAKINSSEIWPQFNPGKLAPGFFFLLIFIFLSSTSFAGDKKVKVAAAQLLTSDNIGENEAKITNAVMEAAHQGCKIILFQEGC